MDTPRRILILTADAGFGHRSAANAVAAALAELAPSVQVDVVNPIEHPRAAKLLRDSQTDYDRVVKESPQLYQLSYTATDQTLPSAMMDTATTLMLYEALRDTLNEYDPDTIVSTYPFYQAPLSALFRLNGRRAAAYRAWWENTPTRIEAPTTADAVIYRGFGWGSLLDMSLLDTRQYRTDQACNDVTLSTDPPCPETFDTDRTMLGTEQREWLFDRLGKSDATWNVLGQQVILGNFTLNGAVLNFDQWDGYPVERDALLQAVVDQEVSNFIVLTGDIHFAGVGNLRAPGGIDTALIGAEFVASSISSSGNVDPGLIDLVKSIGDVVDADLVHRGWIKHTVTPTTWSAEYRIVADALVPDSAVSVFNTYIVEAGTPGIRP